MKWKGIDRLDIPSSANFLGTNKEVPLPDGDGLDVLFEMDEADILSTEEARVTKRTGKVYVDDAGTFYVAIDLELKKSTGGTVGYTGLAYMYGSNVTTPVVGASQPTMKYVAIGGVALVAILGIAYLAKK